MPVEEVSTLLHAVQNGADVAIGSREVAGARRIGEPAHRHLMGRVFNWLVRAIAVPGIEDTQCGFKAFRGQVARELFRQQRIDGWAFDVEVLFLAARRGYSIREVPITWRYDPSSRVSPRPTRPPPTVTRRPVTSARPASTRTRTTRPSGPVMPRDEPGPTR